MTQQSFDISDAIMAVAKWAFEMAALPFQSIPWEQAGDVAQEEAFNMVTPYVAIAVPHVAAAVLRSASELLEREHTDPVTITEVQRFLHRLADRMLEDYK